MRVTKKTLLTAITAASLLGSGVALASLAQTQYDRQNPDPASSTRAAPWTKAVQDEDGGARQPESITGNQGLDRLIPKNRIISFAAGGTGTRNGNGVDVGTLISNSDSVTSLSSQVRQAQTDAENAKQNADAALGYTEEEIQRLEQALALLEQDVVSGGSAAEPPERIVSFVGMDATAYDTPDKTTSYTYDDPLSARDRQTTQNVTHTHEIMICDIYKVDSGYNNPETGAFEKVNTEYVKLNRYKLPAVGVQVYRKRTFDGWSNISDEYLNWIMFLTWEFSEEGIPPSGYTNYDYSKGIALLRNTMTRSLDETKVYEKGSNYTQTYTIYTGGRFREEFIPSSSGSGTAKHWYGSTTKSPSTTEFANTSYGCAYQDGPYGYL